MKPKIQLRNVEADDLPLFFEHQRDPIAVAMVAFNSRDRAAFDQHWAKLLADDSCLKKTIVVVSAVSAENQVAGNIGSWTAEGKREIGYWIDRAYWGRGVATEALSAFLSLEQIRPLHAGVAKHNVASIRVLQKCGFKLSHSVEEPSNDADASHVSFDANSLIFECGRKRPSTPALRRYSHFEIVEQAHPWLAVASREG